MLRLKNQLEYGILLSCGLAVARSSNDSIIECCQKFW